MKDQGAQYVVVKYRTTYDGEGKGGEFFVGSGAGPTGGADESRFEYVADGEWHLLFVDLSTVSTVNEAFELNYLRYDFYLGAKNTAIDVAYMAAFSSIEAAEAWDAKAYPEVVEPWDVDFSQHAITGSYAEPWAANTLIPTMGADELVYVVHYGSIDLGEVNLSKYSKVTISYATPAGQDALGADFGAQYEATAKRAMLLNFAPGVQEGSAFEYLPESDTILASAQYNMSASNMALSTVEIDLTEVDYNGQIYLTFDFRNAANEFGATSYLIVVTDILFE